MPNENAWGPPDLRSRSDDAAIDRAAKELLASDPELNQMVRNGQRGKAFRRALGMIVAQRSAPAGMIASQVPPSTGGVVPLTGRDGGQRYMNGRPIMTTSPSDTLPLT